MDEWEGKVRALGWEPESPAVREAAARTASAALEERRKSK
jgi:hypothetical protein